MARLKFPSMITASIRRPSGFGNYSSQPAGTALAKKLTARGIARLINYGKRKSRITK